MTTTVLSPPSQSQAGSFRPCLWVAALGVVALAYLILVWRAAYLDCQVSRMDEKLAQARLELMRARTSFQGSVTPAALGVGTGPQAAAPARPGLENVPCQPLPEVQESIVVQMSGHEGSEPVRSPARAVAARPGDRW